MDKLDELQRDMNKRLELLHAEFEAKTKEIRDDELRGAIEEMSSSINRRLATIESRLQSLEKEED